MDIETLLKAKRNIVGEIFVANGVTDADEEDLNIVVALAHQLRFKGYSLEMLAENLVNKRNQEIIKKEGIKRVVQIATKAHFPTIQAKRFKPERNKPCPCGSGVKYKKCCHGKI